MGQKKAKTSIQTKHKVIKMVIIKIKMFIPNQKLRKSIILFCDFFPVTFFPTQNCDFFSVTFFPVTFFPTFAQDIEIKPFALLMHVRFTPHGALTHKKCSLMKHEISF